MVPGLNGFTLGPVPDALVGVIKDLIRHLQHHQLTQTRDEKRARNLNRVDGPLTDFFQALLAIMACFLIFRIGTDSQQGGIFK